MKTKGSHRETALQAGYHETMNKMIERLTEMEKHKNWDKFMGIED